MRVKTFWRLMIRINYLRMSLESVRMSSEYWKNEFRILFGCCMHVFKTLRHSSIIFGSEVGDNARLRRISVLPNLSKSCTFASVPLASEPIMMSVLIRRYSGLSSFCSIEMSRGTTPCWMRNFFCLLDPITRFFILFVASKHFSSFSENRSNIHDRKLSTSYNVKIYIIN